MVQILDSTQTNTASIDPTLRALVVSQRPMECLTWSKYGLRTGQIIMTSGSVAFSLCYSGPNLLVVRRFGIGFVSTAADGVSDCPFALYIQRDFTSPDSGPNQLTINGTGNTNKLRTSMPTISNCTICWASTVGVTAGVRFGDAGAMAAIYAYQPAAVGPGIPASMDNMLCHNEGDYPLILAQDEGFTIQSTSGQSNSQYIYFNFELAEVTVF